MDTALRRTMRRCTAVLVISLSLILLTLISSFDYRGIPTLPRLIPIGLLGIAGLYLLGSAVASATDAKR